MEIMATSERDKLSLAYVCRLTHFSCGRPPSPVAQLLASPSAFSRLHVARPSPHREAQAQRGGDSPGLHLAGPRLGEIFRARICDPVLWLLSCAG